MSAEIHMPVIPPKLYITSKGDEVYSTLNGREAYEVLMAKPYRSGFEESLCNAFRLSNGRLSAKQMPWFMKCAMETKERKDRVPKTDTKFRQLDFMPQTFERMKGTGMKWPKILIGCGDTKTWQLGMAGERSREPGTITIYEKGTKDFYGRIFPNGRTIIKTNWADKDLNALIILLKLLETDPEAMAVMYGAATNNCMFCCRELTHPFSVEHGYGPVCAERYGLPHAFND